MVFAVCPYFDMFFAKVGLQLLNLSNSFLLSQSRKQQYMNFTVGNEFKCSPFLGNSQCP